MAGRGATPSGRPDDIWRVEFYFEPIIWNIPGGTQRADGRVYNSARQQTCFLDSDTVTRLKNEGKNTGDIVTRFEPMDATGIKYFTSVLTFAAAPPEDRTRESALLAASRGTLLWRGGRRCVQAMSSCYSQYQPKVYETAREVSHGDSFQPTHGMAVTYHLNDQRQVDGIWLP